MHNIEGFVFDIQHYSIHDGPGVRTNVFIKGCPLHCLWCQNPESQSVKPQIMYVQSKCSGCEKCIDVCDVHAISLNENHQSYTDKDKCIGCQKCALVCPTKARTPVGSVMTVEEVFKEVNKDKLFYDTSGGGITITGGEALSQPEFVHNLFKMCKENGINTAIETCGFAKWETVEYVLEYVDYVLYDVKHMDSDRHKYGTGVPNELILENLTKISNLLKKEIIVRTPVIPGFNDSKENIKTMALFVKDNLPTCHSINLLPYHNMGESKKEQLEENREVFEASRPDDKQMEELNNLINSILK